MRPARARTSSAASGLRFCGIIDEPVVKASDSLIRPASGDDQITISSAKRDRCTAAIEAADRRLQNEIAVGDGIERVRGRPRKAERLRRHGAVERKRRAGKRAGAERAFVEALARIGEAAAVARRHFHISEQMMAERDRLRRLQMGEARHHRGGMRKRLLGERALIIGERLVDAVDGVAHPELEIGRDLIVARTRGMQPPGRRPDQFRQAGSRHSCECPPARA